MSLDREAARAQVPAPGVTGFYLAAALDDLDAKDAEIEKLREALALVLSSGHRYGSYKKWSETGDDVAADRLSELETIWQDARTLLATSSEGVTDATS